MVGVVKDQVKRVLNEKPESLDKFKSKAFRYTCFFYKHGFYKHGQDRIWEINKHGLSMAKIELKKIAWLV